MAPPASLTPPLTRPQLEALAEPVLSAFAEALGFHQQNPTVGELLTLQDSGAWFPFVRARSAQLLVEARLLAKAREVAGVEDADTELLLQWRDAVLTFAGSTRPNGVLCCVLRCVCREKKEEPHFLEKNPLSLWVTPSAMSQTVLLGVGTEAIRVAGAKSAAASKRPHGNRLGALPALSCTVTQRRCLCGCSALRWWIR